MVALDEDRAFGIKSKAFAARLVIDGAEQAGFLVISPHGVQFSRAKGFNTEVAFRHTWRAINEVDVDGADALQSRVTATRLLAVGIFAFAIKKKTGDAYAYLSSGSDGYLVRFPKKSAPEVRALFAPYKSLFGAEIQEKADAKAAAKATAEAAAEKIRSMAAAIPRVPCPKCQQVLLAKLTKCWKCGTPVEAPREQNAANATVQCPFCAEEILAAAIKCKHCGEFLDGR